MRSELAVIQTMDITRYRQPKAVVADDYSIKFQNKIPVNLEKTVSVYEYVHCLLEGARPLPPG